MSFREDGVGLELAVSLFFLTFQLFLECLEKRLVLEADLVGLG